MLKRPTNNDFLILVQELMLSVTSMHVAHFSVSGVGSDAAHRAIGDYYESIQGLVDNLIEQYQGMTETLLNFPSSMSVVPIKSVTDAVTHLRYLYKLAENAHGSMPNSELQNTIDEVKSLINKTKYKLLFLK